jgi:hypothetical protein
MFSSRLQVENRNRSDKPGSMGFDSLIVGGICKLRELPQSLDHWGPHLTFYIALNIKTLNILSSRGATLPHGLG